MRPWQFLAYDKETNDLVEDVRLPLSDAQVAELFEELGLTSEVTPVSFKITPAEALLVSTLVGQKLDLRRSWYVLEAWMFPPAPAESPGPSWVWRGKRAPGTDYWGAWWHPRTGETMHPHFKVREFRVADGRAIQRIGDTTCYEIAGGINWIRESLEAGGRMSGQLLRLVDPSAGAVYACIREQTPVRDFEFASGFASRAEAVASAKGAIELVLGADAALLLAENSVARPGERAAVAKVGTTVIAGATVLAAYELAGRSADNIGDFLFSVPSGYPANAIATVAAPSFSQLQQLTDSELEDLVRATRAMIVRAFDNESLIVWRARHI
jgi:hypothetical protein